MTRATVVPHERPADSKEIAHPRRAPVARRRHLSRVEDGPCLPDWSLLVLHP